MDSGHMPHQTAAGQAASVAPHTTLWYKDRLATAAQPYDPKGSDPMSKVCQVTGKRPMVGNNVSHANNRTKRRFEPNLHTHRFWVASERRFVKLRVSTKGLRIIDRLGIDQVLVDLRARGTKV